MLSSFLDLFGGPPSDRDFGVSSVERSGRTSPALEGKEKKGLTEPALSEVEGVTLEETLATCSRSNRRIKI
jgi:hypothetical protein